MEICIYALRPCIVRLRINRIWHACCYHLNHLYIIWLCATIYENFRNREQFYGRTFWFWLYYGRTFWFWLYYGRTFQNFFRKTTDILWQLHQLALRKRYLVAATEGITLLSIIYYFWPYIFYCTALLQLLVHFNGVHCVLNIHSPGPGEGKIYWPGPVAHTKSVVCVCVCGGGVQ